VGFLLEATAWGRVTQGRRSAVGALAQLMRGRRDREARMVREELERLLEDRDFRVQSAAVEALAVIGEAAAVKALRRMVERELDGRLVRRGKEVIRELQEGGAAGEQVRRLREEVEELRTQAAQLRERVESLEQERKVTEDGDGEGGPGGGARRAAKKPGKARLATERAAKAKASKAAAGGKGRKGRGR
jgi:aminopeptidase N